MPAGLRVPSVLVAGGARLRPAPCRLLLQPVTLQQADLLPRLLDVQCELTVYPEAYVAQQVLRLLQGRPAQCFRLGNNGSYQPDNSVAVAALSVPALHAALRPVAAAGTAARALVRLCRVMRSVVSVEGSGATSAGGSGAGSASSNLQLTPCARAFALALSEQLQALTGPLAAMEDACAAALASSSTEQQSSCDEAAAAASVAGSGARGILARVLHVVAGPVQRLLLLHRVWLRLMPDLGGSPAEASAALLDGLAREADAALASGSGPAGRAAHAGLLHLLLCSMVPLAASLGRWLYCTDEDGSLGCAGSSVIGDSSASDAGSDRGFFISTGLPVGVQDPRFWSQAFVLVGDPSHGAPTESRSTVQPPGDRSDSAAAGAACPAFLSGLARDILSAGKSVRLLAHMRAQEAAGEGVGAMWRLRAAVAPSTWGRASDGPAAGADGISRVTALRLAVAAGVAQQGGQQVPLEVAFAANCCHLLRSKGQPLDHSPKSGNGTHGSIGSGMQADVGHAMLVAGEASSQPFGLAVQLQSASGGPVGRKEPQHPPLLCSPLHCVTGDIGDLGPLTPDDPSASPCSVLHGGAAEAGNSIPAASSSCITGCNPGSLGAGDAAIGQLGTAGGGGSTGGASQQWDGSPGRLQLDAGSVDVPSMVQWHQHLGMRLMQLQQCTDQPAMYTGNVGSSSEGSMHSLCSQLLQAGNSSAAVPQLPAAQQRGKDVCGLQHVHDGGADAEQPAAPDQLLAWLLQEAPLQQLPAQILLQKVLLTPIQARVRCIGSELLSSLLGEWGLLQQLEGLRNTYLLTSPTMVDWADALLGELAVDGRGLWWLHASSLQWRLQEMLAAAPETEVLPPGSSMSVELDQRVLAKANKVHDEVVASSSEAVDGTGSAVTDSGSHIGSAYALEGLAALQLRHCSDWLLSLVASPEELAQYGRATTFLLQLRWARKAVDEARVRAAKDRCSFKSAVARDAAERAACQAVCVPEHVPPRTWLCPRGEALLLQEMGVLLNAFTNYVMDRLLRGAWHDLEQHLAAAHSLDEVRTAHTLFQERVLRQCCASTVGQGGTWRHIGKVLLKAEAAALDAAGAHSCLSAARAAVVTHTKTRCDETVPEHMWTALGLARAALAAAAAAWDNTCRYLLPLLHNPALRLGDGDEIDSLLGQLHTNSYFSQVHGVDRVAEYGRWRGAELSTRDARA